ncbi:PEP-CTERM sorting domain-containing protein [Marinimicrobium agarilyticum]|uniref:PEP-CTERM sorting domain-containing protein n=1 Tax=Marinimicrobium agarilyticum TaxID=306546 RepID=UPI000487297E|nr:PEP-CTERM sorting domain-containing protein [Marinimicrobium agarilyticum]
MKISMQGLRYGMAALVLVIAGHAQALMLMPSDADWTSDQNGTLNASNVASIVGTSSSLDLFYKSNYQGVDEGGFAGSYSTEYWGDPNDALITFTGGPSIICPECYLIVKDGNLPQYLFSLADWNGTDSLDLQDFYPGPGGAISHVAIFGKTVVDVPESSALILMGLGLIGLGLARRRVAH